MKTMIRPRLMALGGSLLLSGALPAYAADWSDTSISYRYLPQESGFSLDRNNQPLDVAKSIIQLTHVSGYKYGSNFFDVNFIKSDNNNPADDGTLPFGPAPGTGSGAVEVFGMYRHNLSLGAVSGRDLKFGPVKDISLTAGFNLSTKNDFNGAATRAVVLGPTFHFALPAGFLNVGLLAYKESNNTAFGITDPSGNVLSPPGRVSYDWTAQLAAAWSVPFHAGIPAKLQGFLAVTGPKGMLTKTETLLDTTVMFDIGSLVGKKDTFYAGIGYRYWNNKFGTDEGAAGYQGLVNKAGHVSTPIVQLEAHF